MVCTKCGAELKDTDLFCLKCGEEVQIVPDYNPVEEIVIQNLALAQQNEITSQDTKEAHYVTKRIDKPDRNDLKKEKKDQKKESGRKKFATIPKVIIAFVLVAIFVTALNYKYKNSFEYQYKKAYECIEKKDFETAQEYLNKALSISENNIDAMILLSETYIGLNHVDKAISCLKSILELDSDNVSAAKQLIELYSDYDYTEELNNFVEKIKNTTLIDKLGDFYTNRPSFSIESGTYNKYISVEITTKNNSEIYYTVDGTKPTTQAIRYSGQIRLRGGTTTVRAIAVNEKGEYSIENISEYTVNSSVPENPVIIPASGHYTSPVPIQITVPENCKVYYTFDGSTPDEKSCLYTKALDMPLGNHTLSVVAIDENGICSNTIQSNYVLEFDSIFSIEQAYNIIVGKLGDELVDDRGAFSLECATAIEIGGYNLYAFEKVYGIDSNGNKIYGSDKIAFDVLTAETYIATINAAGGYDLTTF